MIAKLQPNRVRRTYLGGARIDAFCGVAKSRSPQSLNCHKSQLSINGTNVNINPVNPSTFQPFNFSTPSVEAQPRPEDWLASTTQAFNGTLEIEGEGLGRLEDGRLVRDAAGDLPILLKLLDSDERLVVQAHPTVPCAMRLFNSPVGKTECWYFLPGSDPGACVYLGFKPGITREAWERAVRECPPTLNDHKSSLSTSDKNINGNPVNPVNPVEKDSALSAPPREDNPILSFLHRIPVAPGDFVFVDGGVPHAIGGGCFMIELQEPSDLMVVAERFTPSGRRIPDAKMHGGIGWERMFDVYEYEGRTYEETVAKYVRKCPQTLNDHKSSLNIIDTNVNKNPVNPVNPVEESSAFSASPREKSSRICGPEFTDKFEMWRLAGEGSVVLGGAPAVVVVTDGDGSLNGLPVKHGDCLVVSGEASLNADGALSTVVCFQRTKQLATMKGVH